MAPYINKYNPAPQVAVVPYAKNMKMDGRCVHTYTQESTMRRWRRC